MAGLKRANAMSSPLAQRPPLFDVTHVHDAETRQTLLDLQLGRWVPPSHLTVRDHRLSPLPAERGVCVVHSAAQLERQRSRLDFHRNHEAGKLTTLIHGVRAPFSHSPTSLSLPHSLSDGDSGGCVRTQEKAVDSVGKLQAMRVETAVRAKRAEERAAAAVEDTAGVQQTMSVLRDNTMPAPHGQFDHTGFVKYQQRVRPSPNTHCARFGWLGCTRRCHPLPRAQCVS